MERQALEGLKVLDFCWVIVGPMVTKYLAAYGATVVRVETRRRPDILRRAPPLRGEGDELDRSAYFTVFNSNKYSLTLNLTHPKGREVALRLAAWADLVTENFTPGTMEEWGLGYEDLRRVNPGIIMFSSSMLGRGGPSSRQPGFGPVLSSLSGFTYLTGWPDRDPVTPYGAYTDYVAPRFALTAILAAIEYRKRTGKGLHLDLSQLEASLHFLAPALLDYAVNGRVQTRAGNRDTAAAPHGVYPCKGEDRWCAIACFTDQEWQALCRVMGNPSWTQEERFATLLGRKANEEELDRLVAEWTKDWDALELMHTLQAEGVPAGLVETTRDLFEDPQLKHRGHFVFLEHPVIGLHPFDNSEFRLSKTPARFSRASPTLGQHNEFVIKELLGMSEEEYEELLNLGVLE
jgi:crotonobetainyl-CoA:carnitine CoA-transferase CaiB-like acyl-CoA transferase